MRPSVGRSRSIFCPPHAPSAPSIEPYFCFSQSPNWVSSSRSSGSGIASALNVQKKYESSLMISRPATAGSSISRVPVEGLGVRSRAVHHSWYCLLEILVEKERGEGCLLAVVALQPGRVGLRLEPEREINREVAVDPLGLHRLDDVEGVPHLGQVDVALLVEVTVVDADEVHAVLGEHPRLARRSSRPLLDGPLTAQNRTGSPVLEWTNCEPLTPMKPPSPAVFSFKDRRSMPLDRGERVGLGVEDKPALVCLGQRRGGRRKLVGLQRAPRSERLVGEDKAVEVAVVAVRAVHPEPDVVRSLLQRDLAGFRPREKAQVGLAVGGDIGRIEPFLDVDGRPRSRR